MRYPAWGRALAKRHRESVTFQFVFTAGVISPVIWYWTKAPLIEFAILWPAAIGGIAYFGSRRLRRKAASQTSTTAAE